jgi:hypothetical protein
MSPVIFAKPILTRALEPPPTSPDEAFSSPHPPPPEEREAQQARNKNGEDRPVAAFFSN